MKYLELIDSIAKQTGFKPKQIDIGRFLGLKQSAIAARQARNSEFSIDEVKKLEQYYKISLISQVPEECAEITVRGDVTASMGYGVEVYNEDKTGTYQLGKKLLRDIGANPVNCEMIFASGDSMMPTIDGGDSLLVDLSKKEVYDGKIYCVRIENKLYAKRLQLIPPQKIKVISDNQEKYDAFYIDKSKNLDFDFEIIGEVKWWGRVAR